MSLTLPERQAERESCSTAPLPTPGVPGPLSVGRGVPRPRCDTRLVRPGASMPPQFFLRHRAAGPGPPLDARRAPLGLSPGRGSTRGFAASTAAQRAASMPRGRPSPAGVHARRGRLSAAAASPGSRGASTWPTPAQRPSTGRRPRAAVLRRHRAAAACVCVTPQVQRPKRRGAPRGPCVCV